MRRWLTLPIAIVSLLLCLATASLWIRSHFFRDIWVHAKRGENQHIVQSLLGNLHIISHLDGRSSQSALDWRTDRLARDAIWNGGMSGYPVQTKKLLGFVFQTYTLSHPGFNFGPVLPSLTTHHRLIVIPYWFPTLLFAIFPTLWLRSFLRHRFRKILGHCPKCNYDLRATPTRCPECGWTHSSSQLATSSPPPSIPSGPKE